MQLHYPWIRTIRSRYGTGIATGYGTGYPDRIRVTPARRDTERSRRNASAKVSPVGTVNFLTDIYHSWHTQGIQKMGNISVNPRVLARIKRCA